MLLWAEGLPAADAVPAAAAGVAEPCDGDALSNGTIGDVDADLVDALGLIGQLLDQMVPGQKPRQPEKPKVDIGYRPVGFEEKPLDWMTF